MANNTEIMRNDIPNLNGFPTDNSPSTQLKYDIIANKFMTGIESHQRRNAPSYPMISFGLVGAVFGRICCFAGYCVYSVAMAMEEVIEYLLQPHCNRHKRTAPAPSVVSSLGLIGAVLQGVFALLVLLVAVVHWVLRRL